MAIEFNRTTLAPLADFSAFAPDGTVVGIIGEHGSGKTVLLSLAAGLEEPRAGSVTASEPRHRVGPEGCRELPLGKTILLEHSFARLDAFTRAKAMIALETRRRGGATVLLVTYDEELLLSCCDEVWWLREGRLEAQGHPAEVLGLYRAYVAAKLRESGGSGPLPLPPVMRRGDGRARVLEIETIGADGKATMVWNSGETVSVQVTVGFDHDVEEPVAGIMIRSRIGMEVYGTNTWLQQLKLGPRRAGDVIRVTFAFRCDLCPQEYTLTVASHDPNGVWHEWIEDAVAFLVTDKQYAAGVANLRAQASFEVVKRASAP